MYLRQVVNNGQIPALESWLSFAQARHTMLAENIANTDTPGYKSKQLDVRAFQRALRKAIDARKPSPTSPLRIKAGKEFKQDKAGRLHVSPSYAPPENILFHDRTNGRIERQMSMLAENSMMYNMVVQMLHGKYSGLLTAIRGEPS